MRTGVFARGPGDVLVTSTLKDLVAGSELEFEPRGSHELRGIPGVFELFAVAQGPNGHNR